MVRETCNEYKVIIRVTQQVEGHVPGASLLHSPSPSITACIMWVQLTTTQQHQLASRAWTDQSVKISPACPVTVSQSLWFFTYILNNTKLIKTEGNLCSCHIQIPWKVIKTKIFCKAVNGWSAIIEEEWRRGKEIRVREFNAEDWRIAFHSLSGKSESNTWNRAHQLLQAWVWKTAMHKLAVYYRELRRNYRNINVMLLIRIIIVFWESVNKSDQVRLIMQLEKYWCGYSISLRGRCTA